MGERQITHQDPVLQNFSHAGRLADDTLGDGLMGQDHALGVPCDGTSARLERDNAQRNAPVVPLV